MNAIVCSGKEQPLQWKSVPTPTPDYNEVLIRIRAAALNHRDYWIQKGLYAGLKYPIILGSDGCGIVEAVGNDVSNEWINKTVIINPGMNWGDNPHYQSKSFKILGLPDNGTFGEYVKVPADNIFIKPEYLTIDEAGAIPLSGVTGYRALFTRGQLKQGETLLLTGIGGGTALMMLQMAVAAGANVFVTSGSEDKIQTAKDLGAINGVNYKSKDWHQQLKSIAGGFDVIVDSAAGEGFQHFADLANPGGRIVFFGSTQGSITSLDPRKIFWKQLNILGSTMGTPQDFKSMLDFITTRNVHPVIDKIFTLKEAEQGMKRMGNGSQFGKIVLAN